MQICSAQSNVIITRHETSYQATTNQQQLTNHVISCHGEAYGEAPFPAPSWFCVLDLAWTLSPCMNFSKVQKKSDAENSHHCHSNFFQRKFFKDNAIKIVFSYCIVISPWSHDLCASFVQTIYMGLSHGCQTSIIFFLRPAGFKRRTLQVPNLIRGEKKYHPYCLK